MTTPTFDLEQDVSVTIGQRTRFGWIVDIWTNDTLGIVFEDDSSLIAEYFNTKLVRRVPDMELLARAGGGSTASVGTEKERIRPCTEFWRMS